MGETKAALLIVPDACYEDAVTRAFEVVERSDEPIEAGIEAMLEIAELDPEGARIALWRLQTDWKTLRKLEEIVGGDRTQAALRIGAAIHFARSALASTPASQLRQRLPELLELLGRRQLSLAD